MNTKEVPRIQRKKGRKMDKKQDTSTEGETPESTNRTKNDPTKRQPPEKTCDEVDSFTKLVSNDIFDEKKCSV